MNQASSNHPTAVLPFEKIPPVRGSRAKPSKWCLALAVMFNPGGLIQAQLTTVKWPLVLLIPGLAFALFFMQTGLDLTNAGYSNKTEEIMLLTAIGLFYGTLGVVLISLVGWGGSRLFGGKSTLTNAIRSFSLAYSPTLVYVVLGVVANFMFGWPTAVAFGVTGVLWAMGPMMVSLRQMTAGNTTASVVLATICGALLLRGWAVLGGFA